MAKKKVMYIEELNCPKAGCAKWNTKSQYDCYLNCFRNPFKHDNPKDLFRETSLSREDDI